MNYADMIKDMIDIPEDQAYYYNEKKENEFFLLIGVEIPDGKEGSQFISLPYPVGLDSMKFSPVKGSGAFQEKLLLGNDLLGQLQKLAKESLEPGEEVTLPELTVKIRRRQGKGTPHTPRKFNLTIKK